MVIYTNKTLIDEKKYILQVVFGEFLGIAYELVTDDTVTGFKISLCYGAELIVSSEYFERSFIDNQSLPIEVIYSSNDYIVEPDIPILFGKDNIDVSAKKISVEFDVLGTCFFMLSRIEETISEECDNHDRFPASASIAYKYGFLERPIVDEYVEMLWNMLSHLDTSLLRETKKYSKNITCDVDWPFDPIRYSLKSTIRSALGDLIKRQQISKTIKTCSNYIGRVLGFNPRDPNRENITWMMDVNEKAGNKVAFYFITLNTSQLDSRFDFNSSYMRVLLKEIHDRGHEIGLHPGYNCFDNPEKFSHSIKELRRVLLEEGIHQSTIGGRMHFLRWNAKKTPQLWEMNGLAYDSTLAFADKSGFRCGTCQPFTMFDILARRPMKLKQRPLINMECTVIDDRYEGYGYRTDTVLRFNQYKDICEKYNGEYCLLWHNCHFNTNQDRAIYLDLIN